MSINNEDELFVFMEIQIWNNKDSNGLFLLIIQQMNSKKSILLLIKTK